MSKGVMYVDNIRVEYDNEPNVLEVCRKAGVEIPNFCFHSDLSVYGACCHSIKTAVSNSSN